MDVTPDGPGPESPSSRELSNHASKEYFEVKVHAIPVIDGQLVKSEYDVLQALQSSGEGQKKEVGGRPILKGLEAGLINDFEVPWMQTKTTLKYPGYKRTLNTKGEPIDEDEEE